MTSRYILLHRQRSNQVLKTMKKLHTTVASALLAIIPSLVFSAGDPAEGQNKSATCQACHGPTGISVLPIYPNLAGQHQDYLSKTLRGFRDGSRPNAIMSGFAGALSDADIEDLAAWYASQDGGLVEIQDK